MHCHMYSKVSGGWVSSLSKNLQRFRGLTCPVCVLLLSLLVLKIVFVSYLCDLSSMQIY